MNSEELELSLRTEFESYLKNVLADMRQEISEFQNKVEAEFDKHKSQLDGMFQDFSARVQPDTKIDDIFKETVVEHLRLARDEGARITATAIGKAEELEKQSSPAVGISELRDAINDISSQTSQAAILKTLVQHAVQFTPRGAFFIVKNEHFVGWRVFGKEESADEQSVREIFFPVASSTILGESVRKLSAVESSYGHFVGDSIFLNKLEFGQPSRMFAIPLVARGRGVAVLYADYGLEGEGVNVEALETLVRFAGLTVEVLASSQAVKTDKEVSQADVYTEESTSGYSKVETNEYQPEAQTSATGFSVEQPAAQTEAAPDYSESALEKSSFEYESAQSDESFVEEPAEEFAEDKYQSVAEENSFSNGYSEFESASAGFENTSDENYSSNEELETEKPTEESYSWSQPVETDVQDEIKEFDTTVSENNFSIPEVNNFEHQVEQSFDSPPASFEESPQFDTTGNFSFTGEEKSFSYESSNGKPETSFEPVGTVSETVESVPVKTRFSDRNVDLPIEVGEEERRLHNDARRFARLLVSEIKLYNEQKVKEGRETADLYERLREAIDRSREMYDKRVQPPVAAKFDYFHYELVSTLAEGEETKLGDGYPGSSI